MKAGKTYTIDLVSEDFDAYLRLEHDDKGKLAEDDDGGGFQNSRIVFTPEATGVFRLVVTSCDPGQLGAYRLTIRETDAKPAEPKKVERRRTEESNLCSRTLRQSFAGPRVTITSALSERSSLLKDATAESNPHEILAVAFFVPWPFCSPSPARAPTVKRSARTTLLRRPQDAQDVSQRRRQAEREAHRCASRADGKAVAYGAHRRTPAASIITASGTRSRRAG